MRRATVAVLLAENTEPPPTLEVLADVADLRLADSAESLRRALDGAEVLFVWDYASTLVDAGSGHGGALRWVHAASVGVNHLPLEELASAGVVVTNTRGVFERPIAEYVLALILLFAKDLPRTLSLQRSETWCHRESEGILGRRVLVLGAGPIARQVVPLLRSVGLEVDVVGRGGRQGGPELGRVHGVADIDPLLPRADFLVIALPLTSETRGLVDQRLLGKMTRGARIINIGRGPVLDEAALLEALRSGHISAAGLDVFVQEPLPAGHPFWTMEQVVVSPHMSGDQIGWEAAAVARFQENLRRWCSGEPLLNVVDAGRS